mgnify:CR=1 FL=1
MKKIILLLVVLFVYSCDSGGGGSSEPETNCDICPDDSLSLLIDFTPAYPDSMNCGDGTMECDDAQAEVGPTCSYNDLVAQGCLNIIEAEINESEQTITIYYNVDFNISGFQFKLNDISINAIESFIPTSFTIANNDSEIIAYSITGDVLSDRCGILLTLDYTSPIGTPWNSLDFISSIVFTGDIYTNNIPNSIDVCNN